MSLHGRRVLCIGLDPPNLVAVERAASVMGQSAQAFARTAAIVLAQAVVESAAELELEPGEGSWSRAGLAEARFIRKEDV